MRLALPLFTFLSVVVVPSVALAATLAQESFPIGEPPAANEYRATPIGQPVGASPSPDGRLTLGGAQNPTSSFFSSAWAGDGTSLWQVVDQGIDAPAVAGETGGAARFTWTGDVGSNRTVRRALTSPPANSAGSVVWMSSMVQLLENDGDFDGFALAGFRGGTNELDVNNEGFMVGVAGDGSEMDLVYHSRTRLAPPAGPVTLENNVLVDGISAGDIFHILVRGEENAVGGGGFPNDLVQIWVNPSDVSSEASLGAPDLLLNDFSMNGSSFNHFMLFGQDITGAGVLFDEFALGDTLSDVVTAEVVPEPASIAIWSLIGLGLAGFGYFRVRRKH